MISQLNFINKKITNTKLLVVFSLLLVVFSVLPEAAGAQNASFYILPPKGNYNVGSVFSVDVLINVDGIAVNAAQATIYFLPEKLKVSKISKQNSIFSLWIEEPVFSNSEGKLSFLGGLPSPGFIGEKGKVISIFFKARAPGKAEVSFGGEKILANNAHGTDIFSFSHGGTFSIIVPEEMPPIEKPEKPPEIPVKDTEPPLPFEVIIDNEGDATNPSPLLYFKTEDLLSGISHYEAKIGENVFQVKPGENFPWRTPNLPPGSHRIVVKTVDKAGNFIENSAELKIESIAIPKITVCQETFRAGEEMLFISGTALSYSKVFVSFEKDGKLIKEWEVSSDKEGGWSLAKEGLFKSGLYKLFARAKDSRGAISYSSEPCMVRVVLGGISIWLFIISYKDLALIASIILIIFLAFIIYLFLRIRRTQKLIEREAKDLRKKFYKEYKELQDDIEKKLLSMKKIKDIRPHTDEERKTEEELLKNLTDIEEVFEKELKDIEEIK